MIIYNAKNIEKWKFWRNKSKITYCITSGLFYSLFIFIVSVFIRYILGKNDSLIESSFYSALGAFLPAIFLSIALWYENERRFKKWESENKK